MHQWGDKKDQECIKRPQINDKTIEKWPKDMNGLFNKRKYKHMKRCSISLIIREMQIKTIIYTLLEKI